MRITKFMHSCLLVETPDRVGLFDPGNYSWESGLFSIDKLERLDDLVITHAHPDHFHLEFVQKLVEKFPMVTIVTVPLVKDELDRAGIQSQLEGTDEIMVFTAPHETMEPLAPPPDPNIGVHYLGKLTHPGDSHTFTESKDILALPTNAPWASWPSAANLALNLKPRIVLPIHDWHLKDEAIEFAYERFETRLAQDDIRFIPLKSGKAVEL
jgi:L-ascorbate metabolism protein UlaG (beta-lactamase superfamily)